MAAHRGARLARVNGRTDLADQWDAWAETFHEKIMAGAYREDLGYFTQALGGEFADASLLLLPTLGFIDARDPRFVSTVKAYERLLVEDG